MVEHYERSNVISYNQALFYMTSVTIDPLLVRERPEITYRGIWAQLRVSHEDVIILYVAREKRQF